MEAWCGRMKGRSVFFTFYRGIYYFLAASEAKCLLYRILGVCVGKTNKKKDSKT